MVEGRIAHEGSLKHGQEMSDTDIQVQRAGGEGFSHNEVNPDDTENRMIQLWVLPERSGEPAGYKFYRSKPGGMTRVYGGSTDEDVNGTPVIDGDLIRGEDLAFVATEDAQLIVVHATQ
jgi:redox-sensitive bicupin YhaK (pirin superfamily)